MTDGAPNQCYLLSTRRSSFIPVAMMIKGQQGEGDSGGKEREGGGCGSDVCVLLNYSTGTDLE